MLVSHVLSLTGVHFSQIMKLVQKERKNHYNHLHGFFQGEHTDMSPDAIDRIEFANAIMLTNDSHTIGYAINSLDFESWKVVLIAFRRDGVETEEPDENTILKPQDTLIVRGKPRRVERFERFMQKGN